MPIEKKIDKMNKILGKYKLSKQEDIKYFNILTLKKKLNLYLSTFPQRKY